MTLLVCDVAWANSDAQQNVTRLAWAGFVLAVGLAVFGFPPIDLHEPTHYAGIMAPSCGLTRGVVALVRGSLTDAIRFNPVSPPVLLGGLALLGRSVFGAVTGRWLDARFRVGRLGWVLAGMAVAALAVNQQLHAELLG